MSRKRATRGRRSHRATPASTPTSSPRRSPTRTRMNAPGRTACISTAASMSARPMCRKSRPTTTVIGEVRPRGGVNGLILRGGRIVAEWGDTRRTDMTFSCAKSYIALVAGLAFDRGLISRRRSRRRHRAGRRLRVAAQQRDHLAAPAAADQRVAGHAVEQAGQRRPQPAGRARQRQQPQGDRARAGAAGHALRIQRRAGQPAAPSR